MAEANITQRECHKCHTVKPADGFYRDRNGQLKSPCKVCQSTTHKKLVELRREDYVHLTRASKRCPKCGQQKPASDFYKSKQTADGLHGYCKGCQDALTHKGTTKYQHSTKGRAQRRKWQQTSVYKRIKGGNTRRRSLKKFGLTEAHYEAMLIVQGGVCAICGNPNSAGRRLAVDHCHATSKVRGLLCNLCNTSLGGFKDDPALLEKAIQYLRAHQEREQGN